MPPTTINAPAKVLSSGNPDSEILLRCDCSGHHFLGVVVDHEHPMIYVDMTCHPSVAGWKRRIKYAWRALRGLQSPFAESMEIVLQEPQVVDLLTFLTEAGFSPDGAKEAGEDAP